MLVGVSTLFIVAMWLHRNEHAYSQTLVPVLHQRNLKNLKPNRKLNEPQDMLKLILIRY